MTEGGVTNTSLGITPAPVPCAARGAAITAVTGNVTVNSSVVDSYQSSLGAYGGSNVGANGNVVAKQLIFVQGNGVIRGTRSPNTASVMPLLSVPTGATKLPLGASQPGSINLNSGTLTLAPGNYVVRDMNVNAPGTLKISGGGPVTIYVTNSLNLGGSLNPNGLPSALTFVMTGTGAVNFNSSGRLNGNVYAPASTVTLNSPVYGYVVGGSVTLNTGSGVHLDALEACVNLPSTNVATTTDADAGTIRIRIRLPSGEQIVRIFVRKNGIQVVDQDITSTEAPNNDGTSIYSYTLSGIHDGDQVDYRVFSKLPGGSDVNTPSGGAWSTACVAFDQCHSGTYDATLAKCVTPAKANGSACNDSNACTRTDSCQAGACTGSNPLVCAAIDQCHSAGTCSAAFGCSNPPLADGTSCNDGNACSTADVCSSGTCAGTTSSSSTDPACLGIQQGLTYDPHGRHELPTPPTQNGCFLGTKDGWVSIPCDTSTKTQNNHFEVSRAGVVVPAANRASVSYVYGQVEATVVHTDSQKDVLAPNPDQADGWGVQVNTNSFAIDAANSGLVQFVFAKFPNANPAVQAESLICVYPVHWDNATTTIAYDHLCLGPSNYSGAPYMAPGKLADFDYVNLAGFAFDDNSTPPKPKLATVVQYSMVASTAADALAVNQVPGLYAVVMDDNGLAGNWWSVNGGMMGKIGGSQAVFTKGEVFTTIAASNCTGDTSATGVTCPALPQLTSTNTTFVADYATTGDFATVESDNLTLIRNPTLSFPNRNMVVTQVLASDNVAAGATNASCLAGLSDDIFVKDNDADTGGIPSNSGGVPFWESPDIFIRPAGSPIPQINEVAADFQVTLGQSYDVYLRVNNDFGCTDVSNVNVIIDAADPSLGFQNWSPVTTNADTNQFVAAPGNPTVPAFGKAIVGPFSWSPSTSLSGGHKCLQAAVVGGNQAYPFTTGTTDPWPEAFTSHQIAQRNIQVTDGSTCSYAISNTSPNAANLLMGLNVTPLSSLAGSTITLTFDDNAAHDWFTIWTNQAARLPAGTLGVAQGTGATPTVIVTLNTASLALDTVSVAAGASPTVAIAISSTASPMPNVAISSRLEDPMFHDVLIENGGSCQASAPLISCGEGLTLCGGGCVNLSSDNANCGVCGNACGGFAACIEGTCFTDPG